MDSIFTVFLLFIAALTALLSYLLMPSIPVTTLTIAAALLLAAGVWWHWTQFSIEYRMSTWQENLRNYASYAILVVVLLLSYAFYVFAWSGTTFQEYATRARSAIREAGRKASSQLIGGTTRTVSAMSNTLFSNVATNSGMGNVGEPMALE
jgi:hypothetical protein